MLSSVGINLREQNLDHSRRENRHHHRRQAHQTVDLLDAKIGQAAGNPAKERPLFGASVAKSN